MIRRCVLPALSLLAACGGDPAAPHREAGAATRTITGHERAHAALLDGTDTGFFPSDLSAAVIEAHVPDGAGWRVVPGYGRSDGTFAIPGVPEAGHFWLRVARRPVGHDFYWTDADAIDFDTTSVGPLEVEGSAGSSKVRVRAGGLSPWQEGDRLAWYAPDALDVSDDLAGDLGEGLPQPGDTALDGFTFDWLGRPVIRVDEGDRAWLVQTRRLEGDAGAAYRTPVAAFTPAPVRQGTDGAPIELSGTFASPPSIEVRLAWDRPAFEALRPAIHPAHTGALSSAGGRVFAHAGARDDGSLWFGFEFGLLDLEDPGGMMADDDLGAFALGNPYPDAWVMQSFAATWPVEVPFDFGDDVPRPLEATVAVRSRTLSSDGHPLAPQIGPVGGVRLGGASLDDGASGVAPEAELSFDAPALGAATGYLVQVVEAVRTPPEPFAPGWYLAAQLWLPGDVARVRMPHGLLRPGGTYVLVIRAFRDEGQDLRGHPARTAVESAFADRVAGPFSVAAAE